MERCKNNTEKPHVPFTKFLPIVTFYVTTDNIRTRALLLIQLTDLIWIHQFSMYFIFVCGGMFMCVVYVCVLCICVCTWYVYM